MGRAVRGAAPLVLVVTSLLTGAVPAGATPTSTAPTSAAPTSTAPTSTAPTSTAPTSTAPTSTSPSSAVPSSAAPPGLGTVPGVSSAATAFPQVPPNDPSYAPAEAPGASCSNASVNGEQFYLYSFIPRCVATTASDPAGSSGMSVDAAWKRYTTGRPDTVIAYVEGGINWHAGDIADLVNKVYLNRRELPVPCAAEPCAARAGKSVADYDTNHDGVVDAADYVHDPRVHDSNGNGVIDPEDLIVAFSCFDAKAQSLGVASWAGGSLRCSNHAEHVDNDGDGYPHDISGWDFYDNQNDPATVDSAYGHANGQMRQAAAQTDNGAFGAGVCPRCTILPVKAGAEALDGPVQLGQAWLFAASAGASVVVSVTADLAHSSFLGNAAREVERRGIAIVESSNDFDSTDHQGGMFWPGVLPGNGLVSNTQGESPASAANGGLTTFRARSDLTSWGPHNVLSVSTQGGSTSESTPTLGGVIALVMSYGRDAAERHLIDRPLTGQEAVQVLRATASPIEDPMLPWPGSAGWSQQYGYGRPNVAAAMAAISRGDIPPTGEIDSPDWYSIYDPTTSGHVAVTGNVAAPRSGHFVWQLQAGLGPQPTAFRTIGSGEGSGSFKGRLGTLDLSSIPRSFWSAPYRLSTTKTLETAEQYAVTLRLRVVDSAGRTGEDRRAIYVHHDPTLLPGFPIRIGHGGEAQPVLVDLQGTGRLDIVFGDSDGLIHALDPVSGKELPGWPVRTDRVVVTKETPGVDPGFEPVSSNVAVGDLDHTGHLSVVATSTAGKVYVFGAGGERRAGWPRAMDTGVVSPPVPRPALPHTRLPVQASGSSPVLFDLGGGGRLDVLAAGWDGYLHVWRPDGTVLPGWPVKVALPATMPLDPGHVLVNDANLVSTPTIAFLSGASGPAVVERGQETEITGGGVQPNAIGFLHAYGADGTALPGWPVKLPGLIEYYGSAQQFITEGSNTPVAADVRGDGFDEVATGPVFSPASLVDGSGSAVQVYGSAAAALGDFATALAANGSAVSSPTGDEPVGFTTSGAFGQFGGSLYYAQGGTGAGSLAAATSFPGTGNPIYNYMRVYDAKSGAVRSGFPALSQGLAFLGAPLLTDVSGDGQVEVVASGDSSALEAYRADGTQAAGFPKFDGGWSVYAPAAGDLLSDGHVDLVMATREGYLFAWRTPGITAGNDQWWTYHHDEWRTGRYGTDTRPPGVVRDLRWQDRRRLRFVAPGDDWYSGTVDHYVVRSGGWHTVVAAGGPAGTEQSIEVPAGIAPVTIQAVDRAGNLSMPVSTARPGDGRGGGVDHDRR